ncbi:MAG TPA: response regulator, partial [Methylomirabilota bacterium]|nr:response regulator [Methylomirabilota bacterium]
MTSRPDREPERVDILVVDDRPAKLVAMEVLLADLGENVVCVDSGAAALRQLLARDFAVILLDVNMPEMDGFEVAALIRQRPRLLHIPIIFMTAAGDDTHALRGYSLGAVDYILTPVVPEVLRTKVKVFVDLYRMQEQLKRRAEERIVLAEEQGRRAAAEAASRRAAFLADAGTRMARSLDVETTAKAILALAVPDLADFAMLRIDVGGPEIVHARHRLGEHLSAELDARLAEATSRARRSGARELLVADEDSPGLVRGVVWPLLARGATIGVLGLVVEAVRATLDPVRLTLIGEFAARAAVALDNCLLYREIQERDARKEQFVAMLAHELRNPLGAITSAVGVLDIASGDPAERARAIVKRQLQHLTQLVDDLLDTTRISTGKIELARSSVNLAESVTRCLTTLQVVGSVDEYRIEVESEDTWVDADPARIDQIIANLVGNAVKYTPSGGRISIRVSTRDDCGILEVADTGVGMSPEVRARVFELFYQDDRSPDRRRGGLGIGLTLVRQLAELHGGSVEASSEGEGLGSRFTVRLPLGVPAPPPAAALPEADPKGPSRCRLLIIEDNDDARHMLEMLLSLAGHEVHAAGDGPDGIELARRIQPDVVLIDLGLPGMDGYEVARRLRKDMARTLRLVAISGYGQAEDRKRTLEAGFDMHLVKPVDPMHLSTA